MRAGALTAAGKLVQHAYDVLVSGRDQWTDEIHAIFSRHRRLAGEIADRQEFCIANLASALRKSCRPGGPNLRAEVGALVWSLGMVPESRLFSDEGHPLPGERFFQDIVRQSVGSVPHDPLVQYVWLEMKDRPPLNLRDHRTLFAKINLVYSFAPLLDDVVGQTSKTFARTLIKWFQGDLRRDQAEEYLSACRLIEPYTPIIGWLVAVRMGAFRVLVTQGIHSLGSGGKGGSVSEAWYALADLVQRASGQASQYRIQLAVNRRPELPFAYLLEEELSRASAEGDPARLERVLAEVERSRSAAISHWLALTPPISPRNNDQALQPLLLELERLLDCLRGAYFSILFPMLPSHFNRYQRNMDDLLAEGLTESRDRLNRRTGLRAYDELRSQLDALIAKMSKAAPDYARIYGHPEANVETLIRAISSHAWP